ncbi:MAG: glycerophosphodiester phosphodiesterase family protein [Gammaproteobacteria bacterium]
MSGLTLVAHRGYAARYPENTLPALQAAVRAGARWLEFDVQFSADAVPVLLHDTTLQRTAARPESVFDLSARQLQGVRVGEPGRFGDRFAETPLPTLAEVVAWLATESQVQAFVEVKVESIQRFGIGRTHRALWSALGPVRERCVLISYDDAFLFAARVAAPVRIGWIAAAWDDAHRRRAQALAPEVLFTNYTRLPPGPLWDGPWRWAVYEVDDAELALALAARGITFIETMAVGELLADPRLAVDATHD